MYLVFKWWETRECKVEKAAKVKEVDASTGDEADLERKSNGLKKVMTVSALTAVSFLPVAEAPAMAEAADSVVEYDSEEIYISEDLEFVDIRTGRPIQKPLVRTLHDEDGFVDVAEAMLGPEISQNDRVRVGLLAKTIMKANGYEPNLDSQEARMIPKGTAIIVPRETKDMELTMVVKGDTTSQLFKETGWHKEATFDEFLAANAIKDADKIKSGWKILPPPSRQASVLEARVDAREPNSEPPSRKEPAKPAKPETPVLPHANKNIHPDSPAKPDDEPEGPPPEKSDLLTIGNQIREGTENAGKLEINDSLISMDNNGYVSQEEAEASLDLLIDATRKLENPIPTISNTFREQDMPTPVADRLESDRSQWLEKLTGGDANFAFIQTWAIRQLSRGYDGDIPSDVKLGVAKNYIDYIAETHSWDLNEEEIDDFARMMVRGVGIYEPSALRYAEINGVVLDELDEQSLTLDLISASMEGHLADQIEFVRLADQQLESFDTGNKLQALEESDYEEIARNMISDKRAGKAAGDYLYHVLEHKLADMDVREGLDIVGRGVLSNQGSLDFLKLFPSFSQEVDKTADDLMAGEGPKTLTSFTETVEGLLDAKTAELNERTQSLGELQTDMDQLNPQLEELDSEILYEIAKVVLSQKEKEEAGPDSWFYMLEAKSLQADTDLNQNLLGLIEGIYSASDAGLLWQLLPAEKEAAQSSIEKFLAGEELNLKTYLDGQFEGLEARIASSQEHVDKLGSAVKTALPDAEVSDLDVMTLAIDRLAGKEDRQLVQDMLENYEEDTGREISEYSLAILDLEMLKLEQTDGKTAQLEISGYLQEFFGARSALNHIEGFDIRHNPKLTDYDPVIQTLAAMVAEGNYTVEHGGEAVNIFSEEFEGMLRNYDTNPGSLFAGNRWLIQGYAGQDLTPFFKRLGVDAEKVAASPFNSHLKITDGKIISEETSAIWFDAKHAPGLSENDFEKAVDWVYGEIPGFPYTVKKGDTYEKIAGMFRVDGKKPHWQDIIDHNRGRIPSNPTKLKIGQDIVLPQEWKIHLELDYPEPIKPVITPETGAENQDVETVRQNIVANAQGEHAKNVIEDDGRNRDKRGIIVHYCNGEDHRWDWCACFTSTIAEMSGVGIEGRFGHVEPGALNLMEIMENDPRFEFISADKLKNNNDLLPGDFVFYTRGGGKGHVGVVEEVKDAGLAVTIDGNMGDRLDQRRLNVVGHDRFLGVARYVGIVKEESETVEAISATELSITPDGEGYKYKPSNQTEVTMKNDLPPIEVMNENEIASGDWGTKLSKTEFSRMVMASVAEGDKPLWENEDVLVDVISTFWGESAGGWVNPRGDTHLGEGVSSNGPAQVLHKENGADWAKSEIRKPANNINVWQHLDNAYKIFKEAGNLFPWSQNKLKGGPSAEREPEFRPIVNQLNNLYGLGW